MEKSWFVKLHNAVDDVVSSMTEEELRECVNDPIRFACPPFRVTVNRHPLLTTEVSVEFGHPVDRMELLQTASGLRRGVYASIPR